MSSAPQWLQVIGKMNPLSCHADLLRALWLDDRVQVWRMRLILVSLSTVIGLLASHAMRRAELASAQRF